MSKWEKLYFGITCIVISTCLSANFNLGTFREYCDKHGFYYVEKRKKLMNVFAGLIFIGGLRLLVRIFGRKAIENNLKPSDKGIPLEIRSSKVSKWVFDIVYYSFM